MRSLRFLCIAVLMILIPFTALAQDATPDAMMPYMGNWDCAAAALPGSVNIGAIFALTGPVAVYGGPQRDAVQLAVDQINAWGYLGSTTFNVMFEDSAGDREQAIAVMTKLVTQDNVWAVIGPTLSSEMAAAAPIADENATLVVGVSNTANQLETRFGPFYFRISLPESSVIPGTIAQATDLLGLTQVGLLYGNDDDFTVSGYQVFQQALTDTGITILGEETFAKGDVDFNAQLTNLISQNPDALVVSALAAEATQIILQARALGFAGPIIGGNGFNSPAVLNNSGVAANGLIVGGAWNYFNPEPSDQSVAFVTSFEAAYGYAPDQFAAQAYTGAWVMATALRCGTFSNTDDLAATRVELRDSFGTIADFGSPLGVLSFDPTSREPVHTPLAQIVVDGKFYPLAIVQMTDDGPQVMLPDATPAP